jgi:transcriptional repressor NF-X1
VLLPPVPCGTKVSCSRSCSFPGPECGHSKVKHLCCCPRYPFMTFEQVPHTCHDPEISCPPCPYLVSARCMCGKKDVGNVRCHLARSGKVGCGVVCGKTMDCGWHTCEKLCHTDKEGCGKCEAVCGKDRKGW